MAEVEKPVRRLFFSAQRVPCHVEFTPDFYHGNTTGNRGQLNHRLRIPRESGFRIKNEETESDWQCSKALHGSLREPEERKSG
jgi:hypothetical protein